MGQPAAKQGDRITALDTHQVVVPGTPPTLLLRQHKFNGVINKKLSDNVRINGQCAAMLDSTADNEPHFPTAPGTSFARQPGNLGTIKSGSGSVRINHRAAARDGDMAVTCNDPADLPVGTVVASGNVRIG